MSSRMMNHRQPPDNTERDPLEAIEKLRKLELNLAYDRHTSIASILYEREHLRLVPFSASADNSTKYTRKELCLLDEVLVDLYWILCSYYTYNDGYTDILFQSKLEQLPIDWSLCSHNAWGEDRTRRI